MGANSNLRYIPSLTDMYFLYYSLHLTQLSIDLKTLLSERDV